MKKDSSKEEYPNLRNPSESEISISEIRYKELFNNMSSGVAVYRAENNGNDFVILDFNRAAERIEQIKRGEVIGKSVAEVFPGIKDMGLFEVFRRVWKTASSEHHPVSIYKDERIIGWRENYVYKLPSGEIVAVYDDVTEKKRTEQALKESEERVLKRKEDLEAIFGAIPDMFFRIDDEGKIIDYYAGNISDLYMPPEEFMGKRICDVLPKDVSDKYDEAIRNVKTTNSASYTTYSLEIDESEMYFEARILPFGEHFIIVVRNITADINLQRLIKKQLDELESIYKNTPVGLSYINADFRYLRINKYLADLNGKPISEHIGRTVSEIIPEIRDIVIPIYNKVMESGLPVLDIELSGTTKADPENIHHWLTSFFPQKSDSGSVEGVISVVRDITEQKHAEKQFAEYQSQLKTLASQLTLAEEHERHRIAVGLHDQIGQPLAIAKMKSQMLLESGLSPHNQKEAEDICDLLSSALQDSRSLTFKLSSPVLYELGLEAALASWLQNEIEAKHTIKTEFYDDGKTKPLEDDIRRLLFRNVRELLTNVLKHGQAQNIKVDIRKNNETIEICVEDDGIGFNPVEKTKEFNNQKGYGLFSIREQLGNLGGHIEIDSAVGRGCRVTLAAPLKIEKAS